MSVAGLYKETAVTTQSREKLVVMLYDGAIKFLKLAAKAIDDKNYEEKNVYIKKAMNIVSELNVVLDMNVGGEVAENLRKLYNFVLNHLREANFKCDKQRVEEVISILDTLNQGWKEIAS